MSRNFMREIEVLVSGRKFRTPDFHIDFTIDFDDDPEPNTGEIGIYNLSQETINLIKKGDTVILNAGYRGDVGTIIAGVVQEAKVKPERVDRVLTITVGDATDRWMKATVNKSYRPGIRGSQIIRDLLGMFGLEIGELRLAKDIEYPKGRSITGSLQAALRQVVQDCGSKLTIINGSVFIAPPGSGTHTGFVLNADTGMIDSPMHIDSDDGREYHVFSLLNHRIRANSILKIESMTANGLYRVVKGQHIANESDFMTVCEVTRA